MSALVLVAGLPGTGKTTLARAVAGRLGAAHLRVDAVEAALVTAGLAARQADVGPAGYVIAEAVADTCLRAGTGVVADAVFDVEAARAPWRRLAATHPAVLVVVEVVCRDPEVHRRRVEHRRSDLPGLDVPSWAAVVARRYEPWREPRLVVDTEDGDRDRAVEAVLAAVLAANRT